MHPNTLKAIRTAGKTFKPGQSGNPNGRPKDKTKYFKQAITNIMLSIDKTDKQKRREIDIFSQEIFEMAKKSNSEGIKLKVFELFKDSIDGKPGQEQIINSDSGLYAAGIMLIPPKNEEK
jgi:hypothetical protein